MAGTTSISSLQETLYYQYLINNNSTSTMLNALNGSSDEASGQSDGAVSMLRSIQSDSYLDGLSVVGLNLGEDASDLLGSLGGTSFSNVLESYLQTQQTTNAQMVEKLGEVLDEAARTEDTSSLSYRTVQEIYQYFQEQTSAASGSANLQTGGTEQAQNNQSTYASGLSPSVDSMEEMDFDALEEDIQSGIEASLPGIINTGV